MLNDGDIRPAIIKDIPVRELANEVFAAGLGYALGLQIPQAFIAATSASELNTKHAPQVGDIALTFASLDVSTPSTGHYVVGALPDVALAKLVAALAATNLLGGMYGFDAWTANVDRHLGNLLFDGLASVWMIDHGRCFTGHKWVASELDHVALYRNRLKEWATPYIGHRDREALLRQANELVNRMARLDIRKIGAMNALPQLVGQRDFEALADFLSKRVRETSRLAADALEIPLVA